MVCRREEDTMGDSDYKYGRNGQGALAWLVLTVAAVGVLLSVRTLSTRKSQMVLVGALVAEYALLLSRVSKGYLASYMSNFIHISGL